MKSIRFTAIIALLFLLSNTSQSCSKDDKTIAQGITAAQVNNIITVGTWNVTLYDEAGTIETTDFTGYSFVFNVKGTLVATNTPTIKEGTWNSTTESGYVKIPINFVEETKGSFKSISEDWIVLTVVDSKIELKHTSSEDGSIDLLTFEKI
jgi:hypothetical protein